MSHELPNEKEELSSKASEAEELAKDKDKVFETLNKASKKTKNRKNRLHQAKDNIDTLIRFIKACVSGEYKNFVKTNMILALSAILYFISPFDAVPDVIPTFGFLDDMAIIAFVISIMKEELEAFSKWEEEKDEQETPNQSKA
ncbi:MAG: DUF1232 domain-containing protein [Candidatus Cloacimonetes bacterium]|nr:DUF1232 domain-containing protein [Candidatus Cloacimonadota bacterium]